MTSSASTLVVEGRRIPPGQGLEACPQWCPSTLDLPLDRHYSGPHLPCPNCSAPAHALPSSLGGPTHLWATSPTPITQDALCTLSPKISGLAGLQTAASLSLSHSANPNGACLGMLLSFQLSGCISTHYPAVQANPLGLLHSPLHGQPHRSWQLHLPVCPLVSISTNGYHQSRPQQISLQSPQQQP